MPESMNGVKRLFYHIHYGWSSLWAVGSTVICSTGFAISCLFSRTPNQFRRWGRWWGRMMFAGAGFRVVVSRAGREDYAGENFGTCVFVANHQNSLDIPALLLAIDEPFGFVAKASLERVPFLGRAISLSPSVFVDVKNPRRSMESIKKASQRIASGNSVLVFPEGQRTWSASLINFRRSAFQLAAGADVPIIPIAILNAHEIYDERRYLSRPGTIRIVIGCRIHPTGSERSDVDELSRKAKEEIISLIAAHGDGAPAIAARLIG